MRIGAFCQTDLGWQCGGARGADLAEHLERERDGGDGADQEERPPDGLAWLSGQAIRQQEAKTGAEGRPGADEQGEFRQGNLDFSHRKDPLGSSGHRSPVWARKMP